MHGLNDVHGSHQTDHITSKTDGSITRQIDGKTRTFKPSLMSRVKRLAQALLPRLFGASTPKDQLSLQLADFLPEFKRGTKTRIDFSFKSLRRGMQEDTVPS